MAYMVVHGAAIAREGAAPTCALMVRQPTAKAGAKPKRRYKKGTAVKGAAKPNRGHTCSTRNY